MDQDAIIQYITDTFAGVEVQRPGDGPGAGDTFFFTAAQRDVDPAHRMPFATIVIKDYGEFDNLSQLDRPGVFRLNIGVSRETFQMLFGYLPGKKSAESTRVRLCCPRYADAPSPLRAAIVCVCPQPQPGNL